MQFIIRKFNIRSPSIRTIKLIPRYQRALRLCYLHLADLQSLVFIKLKGGFKIVNWTFVTQKELLIGKKK